MRLYGLRGRFSQRRERFRFAFTIAELLTVMLVIGALCSIVAIAYNSIHQKALNARRMDDIEKVKRLVELYAIENGNFPITTNNQVSNWKSIDVRTDDNCFNGSSQKDWVPGLDKLPQSISNSNAGVDGYDGCYLYASNGVEYVLSAWNMLNNPSVLGPFYRRLGFRSFETPTSTQFFTCNDNVTGGKINNNYNVDKDYYKHSYTVSNISNCNETPPEGA